MNISGIGAYTGNYNYNSIQIGAGNRVQQLREQNVVTPDETAAKSGALSDEAIAKARAGQTFGAEKHASMYQAKAGADRVGVDADITKLDEAGKASEAGKSQLMKQYQMFMGENQVQTAKAARGVENFTF